ncbi:MAG: M48 family metalloprotease [Candidatus Hydrogenedentes bacterium]|nr:M48 family metalloprotease [Candidatus Hydrogenedentota bacterium]
MRTFTYCVLVAAVAPILGCVTTEGQQFNLLTTEEEAALGEKVAAQIEQDEKVLDDPQLQAYLRGIGERLALNAPRKDVEYRFTVIDNPETVNAFALPGGRMYVYTGLIKLCENEAELAAVMAHECGHVAAYHHGEMLTRQYGIELIIGLLLGEEPGQLAQVTAGLIGTGVSMRFSRQNEREADQLGMNIMYLAGYNPEAMVAFMNRLLAEEQAQGGVQHLPIFSSHPATEVRLQYLSEMAQQFPAEVRGQNRLYKERYQAQALSRIE